MKCAKEPCTKMWCCLVFFLLYSRNSLQEVLPDYEGDKAQVKTDPSLQDFVFWPNGTIPFFIDPNHFDSEQSESIMSTLADFTYKTCLRFQPVFEVPEGKHILYIINPNGIRNCHFGREEQSSDRPHGLILGYECLRSPQIEMMVMRSLGFNFEHNRAIRDIYIDVQFENIDPGAIDLYTKDSKLPEELRGLPYDTNSVLHFTDRDNSKNGHRSILFRNKKLEQNRNGLTKYDLRKIEIVYGPECRKRDRAQQLQECQKYATANRRKRNARHKCKEYYGQRTKREVNAKNKTEVPNTTETDALTVNLRANPDIKPNNNVTSSPKLTGLAQNSDSSAKTIDEIVSKIRQVENDAIENLRKTVCKSESGIEERVDLNTELEDIKNYIALYIGYAVNLKNASDKFCEEAPDFRATEKSIQREGSTRLGGIVNSGSIYKSTKHGDISLYKSTKHGDISLYKSTKISNINIKSDKYASTKLPKNNRRYYSTRLPMNNDRYENGRRSESDGQDREQSNSPAGKMENKVVIMVKTNSENAKDDNLQIKDKELESNVEKNNSDKKGAESPITNITNIDETKNVNTKISIADSNRPRRALSQDVTVHTSTDKPDAPLEMEPTTIGPIAEKTMAESKESTTENVGSTTENVKAIAENDKPITDNAESITEEIASTPESKGPNDYNYVGATKKPDRPPVKQRDYEIDVNGTRRSKGAGRHKSLNIEYKRAPQRMTQMPDYPNNEDDDNYGRRNLRTSLRTVPLSKENKEFYSSRKWPEGIVRYIITEDTKFDLENLRSRLEEVNSILKERTCVRIQEIKERDTNMYEDYLVLDPTADDYVTGRVGGRQVFGSRELFDGRQHRQHTAMMVMAMLGFYFENSRHDRDESIRVHNRHIRPDKLHHFDKITGDATLSLPYDYTSATHPSWQFWRKPGRTGISSVATFKKHDPAGEVMRSLGQNERLLSKFDVVKINSVYGTKCMKETDY